MDETVNPNPIELVAADLLTAVAFYTSQFGFSVKVLDFHRRALLEAGPLELELVVAERPIAGGRRSVSIEVDDVDRVTANAVAAGATLLTPPHGEALARRSVIICPQGIPLIICQRSANGNVKKGRSATGSRGAD